jgi:NAD(P)-dependent dehydrogenase (short-subunit alcohol dehydrogenase family)
MTNQNRIVLVTGASGNVGSEIIKQFASSVSSNVQIAIRAAAHSQNGVDKLAQYSETVEIVTMD